MNSDHAPTAEEQLSPAREACVVCAGTRKRQRRSFADGDATITETCFQCHGKGNVLRPSDELEADLLAALRENRELKRKGMWDCDMPTVREAIKRAEAAEAKLRAVSDALQGITSANLFYKDADALLARIRAIVEGRDSVPSSPQPPR